MIDERETSGRGIVVYMGKARIRTVGGVGVFIMTLVDMFYVWTHFSV